MSPPTSRLRIATSCSSGGRPASCSPAPRSSRCAAARRSSRPATRENHEPERPRKLLMHKREIERLIGKTREKGLTLVPTRLYFKGPRAKVEIALARGKNVGDKRQAIKERELKREMERALRRR